MRIAALCFAAVLFSTVQAFAACKGLNARYVMDDAKGFELKLQKATEPNAWSDLDAKLTTPTRTIMFNFTASNGYSTTYMVRKDAPANAEDDASSFPFHGFDKKLKVTDLPQSATAAPKTVFTPQLGGFLWYGSEPREFLPIAMWRLQDCK
jgi:hypothetical protein